LKWSTSFTIHIGIPVPTSKNEQPFTLHSYLETPLHLGNHSVLLKPHNHHIAVSQDLHAYRIYSKDQMNSFIQVNDKFISHTAHQLTFYQNHDTCLSNIFYKKFDKVVQNCNYYLINHETLISPHISQIMEGTFLYFSSRKTTVQILCKSSTLREDIILQAGTNILRIQGNCKIFGTQFNLESSDNIVSRIDASRLPTSLTNTSLQREFQNFISNISFKNLNKIPFIKRENLELITKAIEQVKLENLNNIQRGQNSWILNLHQYAPYIIGIILSISIVLLIIYYCKKVKTMNPQSHQMYMSPQIPMMNIPVGY